MAITTLTGALAGFKPSESFVKVQAAIEATGVLASTVYAPGRPAAMVAPTPGLNGAALTSYAGQIPFTNPVSGNKYLGRFTMRSNQPGTVLLCDRLWHNSGIVSATLTAQAITFSGLPARDRDGTVNGADVMIGIECSTLTSNGAGIPGTVISYTNSNGDPGRTGTMAAWPASAVVGTFVPFQLATGDVGVQSVESITLTTSYGTGVVHLVAYRVIAEMAIPTANVLAELDLVRLGLPRLYDNTVPFILWAPVSTSAPTLTGSVAYTEG